MACLSMLYDFTGAASKPFLDLVNDLVTIDLSGAILGQSTPTASRKKSCGPVGLTRVWAQNLTKISQLPHANE